MCGEVRSLACILNTRSTEEPSLQFCCSASLRKTEANSNYHRFATRKWRHWKTKHAADFPILILYHSERLV